MTAFAAFLVGLPVAVALYAYVVYPLALRLVASGPSESSPPSIDDLPRVSIALPAFNEESQIGSAIDALLAQDYPAEKMQILVISDASTDSTDRIVEGYQNRGVELLRLPQRSGKTKGENIAVPRLNGDVIINTDASIRLHERAVRELAERMAEPTVGVASGRDMSISRLDSGLNLTEAGYVNYEMYIRQLETRSGGIVGASGSLYAIRSHLHRIPIRDDLSRDFSAAMTAQKHGYGAVSVDEAICFVPRTGSLQREFRRKVRTMSRGMRTLYNERALLNPFVHGSFAWKLFSHKVCRWALPAALVPGVVGLAMLAPAYPPALAALGTGAFVLALAAAGALWPATRQMPRIISLAAFGVAANLAVLYAISRVLFSRADAIWEPTRREEALSALPPKPERIFD